MHGDKRCWFHQGLPVAKKMNAWVEVSSLPFAQWDRENNVYNIYVRPRPVRNAGDVSSKENVTDVVLLSQPSGAAGQ